MRSGGGFAGFDWVLGSRSLGLSCFFAEKVIGDVDKEWKMDLIGN